MKPICKKIIRIFLTLLLFFSFGENLYAADEVSTEEIAKEELYSKSAVLMDGSSGRILYEKNGSEFLANASTTKILTCILALEKGNPEDLVTVSAYAASMPDVQLGMREGEQYYLKDLLYSLMLESHNDSAVAIAEHISGSVEDFAREMNRKAREIGCTNSFFVTPNGLDGTAQVQNSDGAEIVREHGTTADDLAKIMRYCIKISPKREEFLEITGNMSYGFTNQTVTECNSVTCGSRTFFCRNHNSFLNMMEGALSGKTGFTGKAGYCYVGALKRDQREYIVALLACGWPNHRNYKWQDTKRLMEYGLERYQYCDLEEIPIDFTEDTLLEVQEAQTESIGAIARIPVERIKPENAIEGMLLSSGEEVLTRVFMEPLEAPIERGETVGKIEYVLNGEIIREEQIVAAKDARRIDLKWCLEKVLHRMLF